MKEFSGYLTRDPEGKQVSRETYEDVQIGFQTTITKEALVEIEHAIAAQHNATFGDNCFPLEHYFGDGLYIRRIFMPAGFILTSKIHRKTHPYFIMSGEVEVLTEKGMQKIKGPYFGMTQAGTKRVILTHTDTIWFTVHATTEKDLGRIENEIIAKSFSDLEKETYVGEPIPKGTHSLEQG